MYPVRPDRTVSQAYVSDREGYAIGTRNGTKVCGRMFHGENEHPSSRRDLLHCKVFLLGTVSRTVDQTARRPGKSLLILLMMKQHHLHSTLEAWAMCVADIPNPVKFSFSPSLPKEATQDRL